MHSPKKYEQVKSKVVGNMVSQKQAKKRNTRIAVLKAKDELYTQQLLSSHKFIGSKGEYFVFEEDFSAEKTQPSGSAINSSEKHTSVAASTTSPLRVKKNA